MKIIEVKPLQEVNGVKFGCNRKAARKAFGSKFKEVKKTVFSKSTMDAYDDYHVYYTPDGEFEAIEIFGDVTVMVNGKTVFPGNVRELKDIFSETQRDSDGWIDQNNSVGVTLSQDNGDVIEAILFGCENYYS